jgi:hypothetical protein
MALRGGEDVVKAVRRRGRSIMVVIVWLVVRVRVRVRVQWRKVVVVVERGACRPWFYDKRMLLE